MTTQAQNTTQMPTLASTPKEQVADMRANGILIGGVVDQKIPMNLPKPERGSFKEWMAKRG